MDSRALRDWVVHRLALESLRELLVHACETGIAVAPIKGVVLAHRLYEDMVERPMNDVDALVRYRDIGRLIRLAQARSWPIVRDSTVPGCLNVVVGSVAIDCSSAVKPAGICAIGLDAMFARATRQTDLFGAPHLELEWNDHLLLLSADAFKDKLEGKPQIRNDLLRMVERPPFDARVFVERAVEAGLVTMVRAVSDWLLESADSPGWRTVRDRLPLERQRSGYLTRWDALRRSHPEPASFNAYRLSVMTRLVSDSARRRLLSLALGAWGATAFVLRHGSLKTNVWARPGGQ